MRQRHVASPPPLALLLLAANRRKGWAHGGDPDIGVVGHIAQASGETMIVHPNLTSVAYGNRPAAHKRQRKCRAHVAETNLSTVRNASEIFANIDTVCVVHRKLHM